MQPFAFEHATDPSAAVLAARGASGAAVLAETQFLAGGTTLLDLMKLDVIRPRRLVDINALESQLGAVRADEAGLHLGGLARMGDVADDANVQRDYPVIAQSLMLAASAQLRNMASLAGNVLQRTRCSYFRDPSWARCNKRIPGSGCAALEGVNRKHAVLGTSLHCIATYPGDFANALVALDARVDVLGAGGKRSIPIEELHREPGDTPHVETVLAPGDLITGFFVPEGPWTRRSLYLKIRDRQSYEFALAGAAVALDIAAGNVRNARIALSGVATKPWRAREAEAVLVGHPLDEETAREAASTAFASAVTHGENAYKPELGRRTLVRALLVAARLEI